MTLRSVDSEEFQRELARLEASRIPIAALNNGSGDGTSGGMEARVAKLEADMDHVKRTLDKVDGGVGDIKKAIADLRVDSATKAGEAKGTLERLEERSKHLPTRWEVFGIVLSVLAIVTIAITVVRYVTGQ